VGGQHHAPAALPPGKTRYPSYRRLGGPQDRSGRVRKIRLTGIRSPDRPVRSQSDDDDNDEQKYNLNILNAQFLAIYFILYFSLHRLMEFGSSTGSLNKDSVVPTRTQSNPSAHIV
jgi:hypothetical protein